MSIQAMGWALTQRIVTDSTARHVLLCLANYTDALGRSAFPSVSTLCNDTGLSERTIRYKLQALQDLGVIKPGNSAVVAAYISRIDKRPECFDFVMTPRGANDDTGCISQQNGVQMTTERGATAAPNTSRNRKEKKTKQPALPGVTWIRPDWINAEAWAGFEDLRDERKRPLTDRSRDLIVNKLKQFKDEGQDVTEILNQSVLHSWITVYPLRTQGGGYPNPKHDGKTDEYGVLL